MLFFQFPESTNYFENWIASATLCVDFIDEQIRHENWIDFPINFFARSARLAFREVLRSEFVFKEKKRIQLRFYSHWAMQCLDRRWMKQQLLSTPFLNHVRNKILVSTRRMSAGSRTQWAQSDKSSYRVHVSDILFFFYLINSHHKYSKCYELHELTHSKMLKMNFW